MWIFSIVIEEAALRRDEDQRRRFEEAESEAEVRLRSVLAGRPDQRAGQSAAALQCKGQTRVSDWRRERAGLHLHDTAANHWGAAGSDLCPLLLLSSRCDPQMD